MVVIHIKRSEEHQFLFETTVEADVTATVAELCEIQNTRLRIQRLKLEGEELAKYGFAKHPDKQSLDEYQEDFGYGKVEKGEHYKSDPLPGQTTRWKCKFCGMDPPDHWDGDCPENPQNTDVTPVRSPQRKQFTNQVFEFASFVPWQFVLLGAVALLFGLQLESDATQSDSIQLLTYG